VTGTASTRRVRADILQTPAPGVVQALTDHVVSVVDGVIVDISPYSAVSEAGEHGTAGEAPSIQHLDGVLMPGLIDTHIHAPQWPQLGTGLDLDLERWLFDLTFPLEARCADVAYATALWHDMVPTLLRVGTTTAVYHASNHVAATTALAEVCAHYGQRALVGRVAMDHRDGTPEYYRDSDAAAAVAASARSIDEIRAAGSSLVDAIVTPRFIPACSDAALVGLDELANAPGVRVQTHCAESDWEHSAVLARTGCRDAQALDRFGLLADHTVLAHGTHLHDDDLTRMAAVGAGVAHCPLSNSYFANAVFGARRAITAGVRVGLGTDVAGGPSASLWHNAAHAVTVSQMLTDGVDPAGAEGRSPARIDASTAMWMATLGGADLLGLPVGLIEVGRRFDAIEVRYDPASGVRDTDGGTMNDGHAANDNHAANDDHAARLRLERLMRSAEVCRVWVDGIAVV